MRHNVRAPLAATAAALAVTLAATLAACGTDTAADGGAGRDAAAYPLTVTDCGRELTIESEPRSILTIGHSAAVLLDAAGAADRIIARSGEFHSPLPEGLDLDDVPIVDPADPAAETIIGAGAEIVVGYGLFAAAPESLEAAGIPNLTVTGECNHDESVVGATGFATVLQDIERFGEVFGTQDAAAASIEALQAELSELESAATGGGRTAAGVYYWSSSAGMSAYGGLSMSHDILDRAGFEDVYGDEQAAYVQANFETLLDADPEVIMLAYGVYGEDFATALAKFESEPGAEDLQAVRNGQVFGIPATDLSPDTHAVRGLRALIEVTAA